MRKKLTVKLDGETYDVEVVEVTTDQIGVIVNGRLHKVEIDDLPEMGRGEKSAMVKQVAKSEEEIVDPSGSAIQTPGQITAPMPGEIVEIAVNIGDKVSSGQEVVVLEAMKMKNKIRAGQDGVVSGIDVEKGDSVVYGQVLVRLEEESE